MSHVETKMEEKYIGIKLIYRDPASGRLCDVYLSDIPLSTKMFGSFFMYNHPVYRAFLFSTSIFRS